MNTIATISTYRVSHAARGPLLFGPKVSVAADAANDVSVDDICDLIDAAGPLALDDIAGGLNRSLRQVSACVQRMVQRRLLERDEFRRYRLRGACAMR